MNKKTNIVLISCICLLTMLLVALSAFVYAQDVDRLEIKSTTFVAARDKEFTTTLYIDQGSMLGSLDMTLAYKTEYLSLVRCEENSANVSLSENKIAINYDSVNGESGKINLVTLTFKVNEQIEEGKLTWLERIEDDRDDSYVIDNGECVDVAVTLAVNDLFIRKIGDAYDNKGDGKINARDASFILQHVARINTLTENEMVYANAFEDYLANGEEKINARDASIILQYVARLRDSVSNRSTVTFYDVNGEKITARSVKNGDGVIDVPQIPFYIGKIAHWSLERYTLVEPNLKNVSQNLSVYAYYEDEVVKHTVSFDLNGAEGTIADVEVIDGNTVPKPSMIGVIAPYEHTFSHWVDQDGKVYDFNTAVNTDLALKAVWSTNTYVLRYRNYEGAAWRRRTYAYGASVLSIESPVREGYTFLGWDKEIPTTMPAENLDVTGLWEINQYTVTMILGNGQEDKVFTQDYNTSIDTVANPEREGYIFVGWDKTIPTTMPAENMTIKAEWSLFYSNGNVITGMTDYAKTLTEIVIPNTIAGRPITKVKNDVFDECANLETLTIPKNMEYFEANWYNCKIKNIYYDGDLRGWLNLDIEWYGYDIYEPIDLYFEGELVTDIVIPNGITKIKDKAFWRCSSLKSVTIPEGVTSIGHGAFYCCRSLESVDFPDSLKVIESWAFYGCRSFERVTLPQTTESIYDYAFAYTAIRNFDIPDGVGWISSSLFEGCDNLMSVSIPDSVTCISTYAFHGCWSLKSIWIPDSVTSMESWAFWGYSGVINCEVQNSQSGWSSDWHGGNPVFYGVDDVEHTYYFENEGNIESITQKYAVTLPEPEREGYLFCGWYEDASYKIRVGKHYYKKGGATFYARWVKDKYFAETYARDGDYIYFGRYPQTVKSASVEIISYTTKDGYYVGSDGEFYKKTYAQTYENGNYKLSDGTYASGYVAYYFKMEPIKWRILQEKDGEALILCETIITNEAYDDIDNNYATSSIRSWLNAEFYNSAFSSVQKELIKITEVDNSASTTHSATNPYVCESTFDRVFLLSYQDLQNTAYGFSGNTARCKKPTDYAIATGIKMYLLEETNAYYGNASWWLRSAYAKDESESSYVKESGSLRNNESVRTSYFGIVPALNIIL